MSNIDTREQMSNDAFSDWGSDDEAFMQASEMEYHKKKDKRKLIEEPNSSSASSTIRSESYASYPPPKLTKTDHPKANNSTIVVRLRRSGGKVVQDCDVYIARACFRGGWNLAQSKWYNPFTISKYGSAQAAVEKYESYLRNQPSLLGSLHELKGKRLGCWCKPGVCHGDILVKLLKEREQPYSTSTRYSLTSTKAPKREHDEKESCAQSKTG